MGFYGGKQMQYTIFALQLVGAGATFLAALLQIMT
jgi:hypothetical protein